MRARTRHHHRSRSRLSFRFYEILPVIAYYFPYSFWERRPLLSDRLSRPVNPSGRDALAAPSFVLPPPRRIRPASRNCPHQFRCRYRYCCRYRCRSSCRWHIGAPNHRGLSIWVGVDASIKPDSTTIVAMTWDPKAQQVRPGHAPYISAQSR
jgi:hypothetical protein